ncbi:MAG: DNA primase [Bacteroidia bacterium]|nr:DNA primase [Bacteroidia bacterium]
MASPSIQEESPSDEAQARQNERESLLIIHEFATRYYQKCLYESPEGKSVGLSYFKERGFLPTALQSFGLGFSQARWDAFSQEALRNGFSPEVLEKSGLSIKNDQGKFFDRFRERVMFPIHNLSGKVIAFGGRILKKDKKQAKYLNSPETLIYHKSEVLYGIFQAKRSIREQDLCYLAEGYTDVLSLHQAGLENVVASSGTSLTKEQIRLIKRFTPHITILYDGDPAGLKASLRGIDLVLEEGLSVKIVVFPPDEDPDSYLKKVGASAFKAFVQQEAKDFIRFKAELYQQEAQNDPIKRAELIREVVNSIIKIPDEIQRRVFYQECSTLLKIDEQTLIDEGNKLLRQSAARPKLFSPSAIPETSEVLSSPEIKETVPISPIMAQEREAIRLLLLYGSHELPEDGKLAPYLLQEISDLEFESPVYQRMLDLCRQRVKSGKALSASDFMQHPDVEIQKQAVDLLSRDYEISPHWEARHNVYTPREENLIGKIVLENILRLKHYQLQKLFEQNQKELEQAQTPEAQDKCMRIALQLEKLRKEIAQQLDNVILKIIG